MRFADVSRGRPFAKDPAVVAFDGAFFLYYSLPPFGDGRVADGWRIGVARGENLDDWVCVGELSPVQNCEANGFCAPGAIVLGDAVHLFYQTYGNGAGDAICHAVSRDGVTFARNSQNPILRAVGDWNNGRAIDADVLAFDGRLFCLFATRDPSGEIQMLTGAVAPLDSDFGPQCWTPLNSDAPLLRPELSWEQRCIEAPALCRHDGRFYVFYGGAYNCAPQQIGCAVSDDCVVWTRVSDVPLLTNGPPDSWNASESGHPFVFDDHALFFQGSPDNGKTWFLSRAEIVWDGPTPRISFI